VIETERLVVRRFREDDAEGLFAYLSNPVVYRFEPGEPVTMQEARRLARERARGRAFWAVALRETGQLVGHLYFAQVEPETFHTWEVGYIIDPALQGRGYATEAAGALIRYGFAHWHIHRVVAHCHPENVASWRVMEKLGMRREGHFRKNVFFRRAADGSPLWQDSYEYALLEDEAAGATS